MFAVRDPPPPSLFFGWMAALRTVTVLASPGTAPSVAAFFRDGLALEVLSISDGLFHLTPPAGGSPVVVAEAARCVFGSSCRGWTCSL